MRVLCRFRTSDYRLDKALARAPALEHLLELASKTGTDMWLCLPADSDAATHDYLTRFFGMVRDTWFNTTANTLYIEVLDGNRGASDASAKQNSITVFTLAEAVLGPALMSKVTKVSASPPWLDNLFPAYGADLQKLDAVAYHDGLGAKGPFGQRAFPLAQRDPANPSRLRSDFKVDAVLDLVRRGILDAEQSINRDWHVLRVHGLGILASYGSFVLQSP